VKYSDNIPIIEANTIGYKSVLFYAPREIVGLRELISSSYDNIICANDIRKCIKQTLIDHYDIFVVHSNIVYFRCKRIYGSFDCVKRLTEKLDLRNDTLLSMYKQREQQLQLAANSPEIIAFVNLAKHVNPDQTVAMMRIMKFSDDDCLNIIAKIYDSVRVFETNNETNNETYSETHCSLPRVIENFITDCIKSKHMYGGMSCFRNTWISPATYDTILKCCAQIIQPT
jgi:hypothetical protein